MLTLHKFFPHFRCEESLPIIRLIGTSALLRFLALLRKINIESGTQISTPQYDLGYIQIKFLLQNLSLLSQELVGSVSENIVIHSEESDIKWYPSVVISESNS